MTSAIERIIESEGWLLIEADCTVAMPNLPAACVDSIVTDPPYGLEFMGKEWDKLLLRQGRAVDYPSARTHHGPDAYVGGNKAQDWHLKWAIAAFRLLKPGGHMLVFGGTRTYHRLACAVEDAGFEIRDSIHWLYGSGFPKSLDVGKAIDKAAGAEREVVGEYSYPDGGDRNTASHQTKRKGIYSDIKTDDSLNDRITTAPATDAAKQWDGWGTALKPAHEPILLARKPLGEKTVAANVLKHGTGGLNIDGGRVYSDTPIASHHGTGHGHAMVGNVEENWPDNYKVGDAGEHNTQSKGRWPANLILQHGDDCSDDQCVPGCPVAELDGQSGIMRSPKTYICSVDNTNKNIYGDGMVDNPAGSESLNYGDKGGASRFFYQAKSSSSERNKGCDDLYWERTKSGHTPITQSEYEALDPKQRAQGNIHPTVKPVDLMRYLVRLITPPGGIVLEPFLGSGTTALAAKLEGFGCLAMESDPTSVLIAHARWSGLHYGSS